MYSTAVLLLTGLLLFNFYNSASACRKQHIGGCAPLLSENQCMQLCSSFSIHDFFIINAVFIDKCKTKSQRSTSEPPICVSVSGTSTYFNLWSRKLMTHRNSSWNSLLFVAHLGRGGGGSFATWCQIITKSYLRMWSVARRSWWSIVRSTFSWDYLLSTAAYFLNG
jgi:hypothetical protein